MSQIKITVSGPVGSGKSKVLAEICATLKAIGVEFRFKDDATRHGVEADMREGHVDWIDLYKPVAWLEEKLWCPMCNGRGTVETCCGIGIPATYWQPAECCGNLSEDECGACEGTGFRQTPVEDAEGGERG